MRSFLKKAAPYFLFISVVLATTGLIIFLVSHKFSLLIQLLLSATVILISIYFFIDPKRFFSIFSQRQVRIGNNILVQIIALIIILVVINFFSNENDQRWDLTVDRTNSLSDESVSLLQVLPEPIHALAFFSPAIPSDTTNTLLSSYQYSSDGNFTYEFVDIDENPTLAHEYNVLRDGTVVLVMGDRQEQVTTLTETQITSAINHLIFPEERVIYFVTGHDEADIQGTDSYAYSYVNNLLVQKNYSVQELDLLNIGQVPSDASMVIIAGPIIPLNTDEISMLQNYMDTGGSLIVLLEPTALTDFSYTDDPLSVYLESQWGIHLYGDVIYDPNVRLSFSVASDPSSYADHPILSNLSGVYILFYTARAIQPINPPDQITLTTLLTSSEESWGETNITSINSGQISEDSADLYGPLPLGVAGENTTSGSRIVVIGDSEFANDNFVQNYGNTDLIINTIDWASNQENLISINAHSSVRRVLISPTPEVMNLIFLVTIVLIPLIITICGVVVWLQRRKKV